MDRRSLKWLPICALAFWTACGTNETPRYVARVGEKEISLAEFETRARSLLRGAYRNPDTLDQALKNQLLDDIIARELLILEALETGLDRDSTVAEETERTEQKGLIDTLYARQALKKEYLYTEEDLQRFYRANEYDVEVRTEQIVCATEKQAQEAMRALQAGESFAALVPKYSLQRIQDRFGADGDIGWFKMGDMLPALKAPLRAMEIGEISPRPVKSRLGYHVFRLDDRRPVPLDSVRASIAEKLRIQEIGEDRARYVQELRRQYALEEHGDAIKRLISLPADQRYWKGEDEPLFTWKDGSFTIGDYLAMHRRGRAKHPASLDSVGMYKTAENLAGQRIMKTEARRLGYDRDPAILAAVEKTRDERMIGALFRREARSRVVEVTDADVRAYYDANIAQFTNRNGEVTDFAKVSDSIRSLLRKKAGDKAMDDFIGELREKYRDRIEIRPEVLAQAQLGGD